MDNKRIIKTLISSRKRIIAELKQVIINNRFNYRTFGTSIEDPLFDIVISILKERKLIVNNNQFKRAKDKNEFPDLAVRTSSPIALEAKAGNRSKLDNGKWKPCKNSANDLGTINMWEKKLSQFNGNDIYFIFIEYNFTDTVQEIIDVKVEPFFRFIGLNKAGLLSYREKDGNLRPKDFDAPSPITKFETFLKLLPKTKIYRASRLVKKHLGSLNKKEINEIMRNYSSDK